MGIKPKIFISYTCVEMIKFLAGNSWESHASLLV